MSDGRIAVSGGPFRFELLLYNHLVQKKDLSHSGQGRNDSLNVVESVDTQGMQVHHLIEVYKQFLIAVGQYSQILIFQNKQQKRTPYEKVQFIDHNRQQVLSSSYAQSDTIHICQIKQFKW